MIDKVRSKYVLGEIFKFIKNKRKLNTRKVLNTSYGIITLNILIFQIYYNEYI